MNACTEEQSGIIVLPTETKKKNQTQTQKQHHIHNPIMSCLCYLDCSSIIHV